MGGSAGVVARAAVGLCIGALAVTACATGDGSVSFGGDGDDDGAGGTVATTTTASTGTGGSTADECTADAYCQHLADDCNRGICTDGRCETEPWNDGDACEDEDMCTTTGTCSAGSCQGGPQIDCSELDDDCGVGVCDSVMGCVREAANAGGSCDDGLFCTSDDVCDDQGNCAGATPYDCGPSMQSCSESICDEALDACTDVPISTCVGGDNCCPMGCTLATDTDCNCANNLATTATPLSSGGGSASGYALTEMNNGVTEPTCNFHWINNGQTPTGAYIEYQWATAVTIGSTYVTTANATNEPCSSSGRNMETGTVQYWDGAAWVTATTFSGQTDDVQIDLPQPVTTTRLRIFDITSSPGNGNAMIFEWYVYAGAGCTP